MFREVFFNKWILGGYALAIVFGIGCYFWYQHQFAPYKHDAIETTEVARGREATQKAKTNNTPQDETNTPADVTNPTAEKTITETTPVTKNTKPTQAQTDTSAQNAETADVPVSPFGFGPYPDIPKDYPIPPSKFKWEFWGETLQDELMSRVRIKLWKQGVKSEGITAERGLLYPIRRGIVYIKRSDNGKDIIDITGHPKDMSDDVVDQMYESGTIPAGLTVFDYDKAGIDPYKFLNLQTVNSYDEASFNARSRYDR